MEPTCVVLMEDGEVCGLPGIGFTDHLGGHMCELHLLELLQSGYRYGPYHARAVDALAPVVNITYDPGPCPPPSKRA